MLRLILGRAGTGKTALLFSEIAARCARRQSGSFLIVPEQYSHEAERELAQRCGDTASLYAEVLSFSRLAHRVAIGCGGSARVYIDKPGRFLQLSLALEQVGGALSVYGGSARSPERMVQLLSALDELRFGCAAPDALRKAAESATPSLAGKLRDLALLQEALDALSAQSGADPAGRLDVLAEQLPGCTWLRSAKFYIDGFTDFTAQERRVIRALLPLADVTVCLTCDDLASGSEVFSLARRTMRALRDAAEEDGVAVEIVSVPRGEDRTPFAFLEENLFGWTDETRDAAGSIRLVRAPGVAAECELAAAEMRRLVRETSCRWRDIAVAVRGFGDYRAALEEACRRAGVPLYASERTDIFTRPLPALIAAAFDILADGWSYESVFTYLKTGLTGISRADCDALENYVLLWSLRGTAWTREEPWRQHPDGFGGKITPESDARSLQRSTRCAGASPRRSRRSSAAEKEATDARGQCAALAAFWEDISLPEHLEERSLALEEAGELQAAAEYRQLWELIVSALEQCDAILGDMPLSQEDFGRLFRRMLSQYDVGTIPVALDRVTAGDFDRMRRRSIRHLLVLGASDERLPRVSDGAGVFTDTERSELRALDIELSGGDDELDREFNLIYNVFTLPKSSLYVSRSAFASGESETRPSFVTDRIAKLFALCEETATCMPRDAVALRRWSWPVPETPRPASFSPRAARAGASPPSKRPPRRNAGGSPARACARSTGRSSISRPRASITLPPAGSSSSCVTVCAPSRARARSLPRRSAERFCTSYWKTWRASIGARRLCRNGRQNRRRADGQIRPRICAHAAGGFSGKEPPVCLSLPPPGGDIAAHRTRHGAGAAPLRLPPARL